MQIVFSYAENIRLSEISSIAYEKAILCNQNRRIRNSVDVYRLGNAVIFDCFWYFFLFFLLIFLSFSSLRGRCVQESVSVARFL